MRLIQHLQYSKVCADYMIRHAPMQAPPPGWNSRAYHTLPVPALCPPVDVAVLVQNNDRPNLCDPESEPHVELTGDLLEIFLTDVIAAFDYNPCGPTMSIVHALRECMRKYPIPFDQIHLTWTAFANDWRSAFLPDTPVAVLESWQKIVDVIQVALCPSWLVPPTDQTIDIDSREGPWQWIAEHESDIEKLSTVPDKVPRHFKERYVIHVFSGHRRADDVQTWIERLPCPDGVVIHAVSLDVVFGADCDLLNPSARTKWLSIFQQGAVHGFYSGPPCETWSSARFVELINCKIRPLRSQRYVWGLPSLSLRELRQLATANTLMYFVLALMIIQRSHGLFGCMEHPMMPKESYKPSIWRSSLWRCMSKLGLNSVTIHQGLFGAASPKPTTFAFTIPIRGIREIFAEHQVTTDMPKTTSIGRDQDGSFKTSALKAYPAALSGALVQIYHRWTLTMHHASDLPLHEVHSASRSFMESFEPKLHATMGPDYVAPTTKIINFAWN